MNGLYGSATPNAAGYRDVAPERIARAEGTVRVVDVREPDEFRGELGHIAGAELVPLATVEHAAKAWPRDEAIVVVCRSGARSGRAAALLVSAGFRYVMNMAGGMLAWQAANLPSER